MRNAFISVPLFAGNDSDLPATQAHLWRVRTKPRQSSLTGIVGEETTNAASPSASARLAKCNRARTRN